MPRLVLDRHALRSHRLVFDHPVCGKGFTLEAPMPGELAGLVVG